MNSGKTESLSETNGGYDTDVPILGRGDRSGDTVEVTVTDGQDGETAILTPIKTEIMDFEKEELNFVCDICGRECSSSISLQFHKNQVHERAKLLTCQTCGKSFKNNGAFHTHKKSHLQFHEQTHERIKQFTCHTCGRSFKNNGAFHTHKKSHLRNIQIEETHSEIKSRTGSNNLLITRTKSEDQVEVENQSESVGSDKMEKVVSESSLFLIGDKIVPNKETFQAHMTNHSLHVDSSETRLECTICFKICIDDESLQQHLVSHMDEAQLQLNCKDNDDSNIHREEWSYKCSFCSKSFSVRDQLSEHMKSDHSVENPFICSDCGEVFSTIGSYETHMKTHVSRELFKCRFCDKSFTLKNNFQKHMKYHIDKKIFKCSICNQPFKVKGYLLNHMKKYHAGENMDMERSPPNSSHVSDSDEVMTHNSPGTDPPVNFLIALPVKEENSKMCKICNKVLSRAKDLDRHMKIHTGEKYKCNLCSKLFARTDSLLHHKRLYHKESFNFFPEDKIMGSYECKLCSQKFQLKTFFDKHMKDHFEKNIVGLECKKCGKLFHKAAFLHKHIMTSHSEDRPYKCNICGRTFEYSTSYSRHMLSHPGEMERPHVCDICNKSFAKVSTLNAHMKIHNRDKPFKCQTCNKAFITRSCLRKHSQSHSDEKPFRCDGCGQRFRQEKSAKRHMLMHSGERPHKCSICNKTFEMKFQLSKHMNIHSKEGMSRKKCRTHEIGAKSNSHFKEKMHGKKLSHTRVMGANSKVCSICNKVLANAKSLTGHMRIHSGEKYRCDFCDKSFARIYVLKSHLRIIHKQILVNPQNGLEGAIISVRHGVSGSKKVLFKCPVCSLLFIHRNEVVTHIRIHTGQKPYECSVCGATFNGRDHLQEHMDTHQSHTGKEKVCSFCGKQFVKTSDFKRHMRMHSGVKPFGCVLCGKAFARKDGMLAHAKKKH